jgi:hypothetical protein
VLVVVCQGGIFVFVMVIPIAYPPKRNFKCSRSDYVLISTSVACVIGPSVNSL